MFMGRIMAYVGGKSLVRHQILTKIFVASDVLALAIQGSGGGQLVSHLP
jgi:hypothetical protein